MRGMSVQQRGILCIQSAGCTLAFWLSIVSFLRRPCVVLLSRKTVAGSLILFALGFFAVLDEVSAAAWLITPSVRLDQQFDDNIRLSSEDEDAVFGTEITGAVELSRLTDILEVRGRLELDYITYIGDDENLPDEDAQLIDLSSLYRTELGEWQFDGSYRRDTLLRTIGIDLELEDFVVAPGEDIDILVVERSIRRNRIFLEPAWRRDITERSAMELAYRFNYASHEDVEDVNINDFQQHQLTGELFYDLSERTRLNSALQARRFETSDGDREFDSYALLGGLDYAFSKITTAGIQLGVRQTSFETPDEDGDDTGFLARIYGNKRTLWGRFGATLERQLFPSTRGGLVQTDQLILRMNREITPRLNFSMGARLFSTETLQQGDRANDRDFVSVEPRLSWNLTRWWLVGAAYRYRWEDRDVDSGTADSNAVFISLTYSRPTELPD